jgi:outer membrane protein assembly factor BamB
LAKLTLNLKKDSNVTCFFRKISVQIALLSIAILFAVSLAAAQESVSLSPAGGPPTTKLQVSGSGYTANAEIKIYFDLTAEAVTFADSSGSFSKVAITAPQSAKPGKHWVSAVQQSNDTGAQSPFWVHTDWVQFGFSPLHAQWNPFENVLDRQTVSHLAVAWSSSTSGPAAVAKDAVYLGSGDSVYSLNASSGKPGWQFATNGAVAGPPAVVNGVLYIGSGDFNVYALNISDGTLLWQYPTGSYVISAPVVANAVVYVGSDDNDVYALNATEGTLLWKYATGNPVQFTPAVFNGVVYVASSDGNIYALNAATGSLDWKFLTTASNNGSTPSVANGTLYMASADGNLYALNASNGNLLWKTPLGAPADGSTAAVANGVVYVGSGDGGVFYAINAYTGAVLWKYSTKVPVYSASVVADGVVYFGDGSGFFYAMNATTGALLWKYTTAGFFPSAAVTNGRVYLAADKFYVLSVPGSNGQTTEPPSLKALH